MTIHLYDGEGDSAMWEGLSNVWVGEDEAIGKPYPVEEARAYRDRLVLKLGGIDSAEDAEALKGRSVAVSAEEAPRLDGDEYYRSILVGMQIVERDGTRIGSVRDVLPTGGTDVLIVDRVSDSGAPDVEALIPLAASIVLEIDAEARQITVELPSGLLELNANTR